MRRLMREKQAEFGLYDAADAIVRDMKISVEMPKRGISASHQLTARKDWQY